MSTGYCGTCLRINQWIVKQMDTLSQYAGGTNPYEVAQDFTLRGEPVCAGDTVQLSTAQAAMYIEAGLVKAPAPTAKQPITPVAKSTAAADPK
jgi:hypothetical protein